MKVTLTIPDELAPLIEAACCRLHGAAPSSNKQRNYILSHYLLVAAASISRLPRPVGSPGRLALVAHERPETRAGRI